MPPLVTRPLTRQRQLIALPRADDYAALMAADADAAAILAILLRAAVISQPDIAAFAYAV